MFDKLNKLNKKFFIYISIGGSVLLIGSGIIYLNKRNNFNYLVEVQNIPIKDKKIKERLILVGNLLDKIYKNYPDVTIDASLIERMGGNCKVVELVFKKLNIKEINKDNYKEVFLNFLKTPFAKKYSINTARAFIMIFYSLKTKTFPKPNGKMDDDIFKPLEKLY